ncbi:acyl dehydratase [bacterium M00.F.Ca.ET.228.01.1.1]|uniref:MaoC/PaaZ C-terminal domain-containing protein n=1 Tax=Paraburkholderia phenoliruptrix TaxID=252970 RepID=UPI0010925F32|nr:MaoC/PaaZ C-terminal domain-containing protein [Paraburkholderia phenoliruptrix]TGP42352.1 acyl dehydratase [bacterium M00.F.Ca.ET.228.01.1.1]TGS00002.1 acyl dehydratase [bacterium M00.F.Ca.ET.191.01.1.1]TGU04322.1 acyl dehydratase [bacterium M00.F.Ca.ET.155.01.1.1]MBW0450173.1 acyl dehydratase [Paraburkholderia phenoliruptrix]MBW9098571.1 acyl dehydratase [Paraburkholderia phenoliruptrix]
MEEPGDPFGGNRASQLVRHETVRPKTVVVETLPTPARLYARALSGIVKRGRPAHLPALRLVRPAVALEPGPAWRYARVCGFIPEHGVPLTYPHLLAFPLHLLMLTDPAFPWPAVGLLHLANHVRLRRPLAYQDLLRVEVEFGALLRHDKGQAFLLHTRIYRRGEAVWDGDSVYLKRGVPASGAQLDPLAVDSAALQRIARWQLAPQLGRDYASVSGDYNPIHLSALSAKAFGFPRAIAHGMWTLARAASSLQPPKPLAEATLSAEFKLPMPLPGEASLWSAASSLIERDIEVRDIAGEKPHLRGRMQWRLQ